MALFFATAVHAGQPGTRADAARGVGMLDPAARFAAVVEMQEVLGSHRLGSDEQREALRELSLWAEVPRSLFDRLLVLSTIADETDRVLVVQAMGGVRSREAASFLVSRAGTDPSARVRSAAFTSLATLSGRDDLGRDLEAWQLWSLQGVTLSESEWRGRNQIGLAARAKRLEAERKTAAGRLVDAYRSLWLAQADAKRDRFLADLLGDAMPELHRLGVELARLELSSGGSLGEAVVSACKALLVDPSPARRREAAGLIDLLAPPFGGDVVADALAIESSPEVATNLLRASARWPMARNQEPAMRWLESAGEARAAAAHALLAIDAQEVLLPETRLRITTVLRERSLGEVSGAGMRLLASLGNDDDRRRIARAMTSEQPAGRRAAAEALWSRPEYLEDLLDAAALDPALFGPALRAATQHRPDADSFLSLLATTETHQVLRWDALIPLAQRMSSADVMRVAWATSNPTQRERLFELALPEPGETLEGSVDEDTINAAIELARLRLDAGRAGEALEALAWLPETRVPSEARWIELVSLVSLGRLDEAEALGGPAAAWIDGLARSKDQPFARSILERITQVFKDDLDGPAREQLATIEENLRGEAEQSEPSKGSD